MSVLEKTLLNENSTWEDFGLFSINEDSVGIPFSQALKSTLVTFLDMAGSQFIAQLVGALQLEVPEQFSYNYGYGYGYGCGLGIDYILALQQ